MLVSGASRWTRCVLELHVLSFDDSEETQKKRCPAWIPGRKRGYGRGKGGPPGRGVGIVGSTFEVSCFFLYLDTREGLTRAFEDDVDGIDSCGPC